MLPTSLSGLCMNPPHDGMPNAQRNSKITHHDHGWTREPVDMTLVDRTSVKDNLQFRGG